ncbi:MAG: ATP-binding protein [Prochlorococcaceae cyanobacterium]
MDELRLNNHLDELERLSLWVAECAEKHALSDRSEFALDLVLTELVTNIIDYSFPGGGDHVISVTLQVGDGGIEVTVTDDGAAFDPTANEEVQLPTQLSDAPIGGLGVHLVKRYCESFTYQRRSDRNEIRLRLQEKVKEA